MEGEREKERTKLSPCKSTFGGLSSSITFGWIILVEIIRRLCEEYYSPLKEEEEMKSYPYVSPPTVDFLDKLHLD